VIFFFQAEDGIRDFHVTGVQTCALPIYVLINCIGSIDASSAQGFDRVHVELTRRIIDNRHAIGNPRIVQISALGASPMHRSDFLRTKGIANDLLLQHPDTIVIRPSIVCTHRTVLVRKMLMLSRIAKYTAGWIFVPKGFLTTRIQPVTPDDLAGIVKTVCMRRDHGVVEVAGPEVMRFADVLALLSEVRNQKIRRVEMPRSIMDSLIEGVTSQLFPSVISVQQYGLLFEDNTADNEMCAKLLERPMTSVISFFQKEFSNATY